MSRKPSAQPRAERRHAERRGPRGLRGPAGRAGPAGPVGPQGRDGPRGKTGKTGPKGAVAEPPSLELVNEQIDAIGHELSIQLQRMAQIQYQLDELRANVNRLMQPRQSGESGSPIPSAQPKAREH